MSGALMVRATSEFVDLVRGALDHLYDPAVLRASPLMELMDIGSRRGATALRAILIDATNILKPRSEMRTEAPAWRPYRAVYHRYVEQFPQQEVAASLSLSVRQLRREEKKAIASLADYLWARYDVQTKIDLLTRLTTSDAQEARPSSQEEELRWLAESSPSQVVRVQAVVTKVLRVVRSLADPLAVRLEPDLPEELPAIQVRVTGMRQALLGVLTTAIRLVPGGAVRLSAEETPDGVLLHMWATAGADRPAPSFEVDELGLSSELAELSGAEMRVAPSYGKHEVFAVTVHFCLARKQTILVIDDNADTLELLNRYLVDTPYAFLGVRDPQLAVDTASAARPALIFLDVMLPLIDGWELLQRLREHPHLSEVPIVVCSILSEDELARALGAAGLLRKPVTRQAFLSAIECYLGPE